MNYYPHHIADFNNATRHLAHVERSLYRDLIDLYYETEKPLPAGDFEWLARRVLARSDDEKAALRVVLGEFFMLDGDVYRHTRCDAEILVYKEKCEKAREAGKAGGLARAKRQVSKRQANATQTLSERLPNQEPITKSVSTPAKTKKQETPIPPDFAISERVRVWAAKHQVHNIEAHLDAFISKCRAKGYTYVDWDEALMGAVRDDWAKIGKGKPAGTVKVAI